MKSKKGNKFYIIVSIYFCICRWMVQVKQVQTKLKVIKVKSQPELQTHLLVGKENRYIVFIIANQVARVFFNTKYV
jgi:hypothetical protein